MSKVSRKKVMIYDEMRLISLQSAILPRKIAFENNELFYEEYFIGTWGHTFST